MAKGLPVVGVVGAVSAACVVAVLVNAALFVVVLVAVGGSIVLLGQRSIAGAAMGLVVLVLAVCAGLGLAGSVTTEDGGETDLGIGEEVGVLLALAAMLALPVAATVLRWDALDPAWPGFVTLACAIVAFGLAATDPSGLADHGTIRAAITAALCLGTMAASVRLLRGDREAPAPAPALDGPAPLAAAEAPVRAHAAGKGASDAPGRTRAAPRSPGRRP